MHRYHGNGGIISFPLLGGRWNSCRMLFGHEPLKKADTGRIYLALVKCINDKNLQVGKQVISKFTSIAAISTGLHYIISGQSQQKSSNKTAWFVHDIFSHSSPHSGWNHYSSSILSFGTLDSKDDFSKQPEKLLVQTRSTHFRKWRHHL